MPVPRGHWPWWLALMWSPVLVGGCLEDADCPEGLRCLLANRYENRCGAPLPFVRVPAETARIPAPSRGRGGTGYPCQFNVDCQPGFACYKVSRARVEGECLQLEVSESAIQ